MFYFVCFWGIVLHKIQSEESKMSKTIRIDDEVYARLGALSTDFDSPSETIRKIVLQYETTLAADLIRPVIEGKKENLIAEEKLGLKKCSFTVLHHFDVEAVKSVMESIKSELSASGEFEVTYDCSINALTGEVQKKEK